MSSPVPPPSRSSSAKGWRKPVPNYIPSPPSSPPLSQSVSLAAFSPEGTDISLPPLPENHLDIVQQALHRYQSVENMARSDGYSSNHGDEHSVHGSSIRELASLSSKRGSIEYTVNSSPATYYSMTLYPGLEPQPPHSARSTGSTPRKASLPHMYRPPTPPLPSARPKSYIAPRPLAVSPEIRSPYRMIMPDPPSIYMKDSTADLERFCAIPISPAPSSLNTSQPSAMSLTSEKTRGTSLARTQSWDLPDFMQEELARQKEGEVLPQTADVLPVFRLPRTALAKNRPKRTCSGMVWECFVAAGRAVSSCFRRSP